MFPKGAKELDDALVSQPLEWLNEYPQAKKEWVEALRAYSDATDESASDVADKFRKALERFFQEFFHLLIQSYFIREKTFHSVKAIFSS